MTRCTVDGYSSTSLITGLRCGDQVVTGSRRLSPGVDLERRDNGDDETCSGVQQLIVFYQGLSCNVSGLMCESENPIEDMSVLTEFGCVSNGKSLGEHEQLLNGEGRQKTERYERTLLMLSTVGKLGTSRFTHDSLQWQSHLSVSVSKRRRGERPAGKWWRG